MIASTGSPNYRDTPGTTHDNNSVLISPDTESTAVKIDQLFRVCFSVKPLSRLTTQNPESFIHEIPSAPYPIDRKIYTG
jgi:hypothetical protein